ncbi:SDR family NAD(P)-dependent oxidoreductase [Jatrophihabitans sp. DSM 45814]
MSEPLTGRVALVTGAARGVGKVLALELADMGATVIVTARSEGPETSELGGSINETVSAITQSGHRAMAIAADLVDPASLSDLISTVRAQVGEVDILVNNAADTGDRVFHDFTKTDPAAWRRQFELNVFAMYDLMHAFVPGMRDRREGFVINLGSLRDVPEGIDTSASVGDATLGAAYPTTKLAIYAMTTLLANEFAKDNVVAFTLTPGLARTERLEDHAVRLGFDPAVAVPPELAGKAVRHILSSSDPLRFAGRFIEAAPFVAGLPLADETGAQV